VHTLKMTQYFDEIDPQVYMSHVREPSSSHVREPISSFNEAQFKRYLASRHPDFEPGVNYGLPGMLPNYQPFKRPDYNQPSVQNKEKNYI
jgi:hypothetical protein